MKKIFSLIFVFPLLASCDSTIQADYDTIRAKKIILLDENGNEFMLQVKKDSTGTQILAIEKAEK